MKPTPFLTRRCSLPGCERQAHFTLDQEEPSGFGFARKKVLCDKHALMWGLAHKKLEKWQDEEHKKLPDFETQHGLGDSSIPQSESVWTNLPWNYGAEDVK